MIKTQTSIERQVDIKHLEFIQAPVIQFSNKVNPKYEVRLIRLDEINEEGHQAYRQALSNVYATMDPQSPVRLLYLLDGGPDGVNLYFGVIADSKETDVYEVIKNLRGALEGQLPGINFDDNVPHEARERVLKQLCSADYQGVVLGAPTGQSQEQQTNDEQGYQGVNVIKLSNLPRNII